MTNQHHEPQRHLHLHARKDGPMSKTRASPSPLPLNSVSKKQALLEQKRQHQAHQEPWLFQSVSFFQSSPNGVLGSPSLPGLPTLSPSSLSVSPKSLLPAPSSLTLPSPSPFYLDVESLRSLLPTGRRPHSGEDSNQSHQYGAVRRSHHARHGQPPPVRLEPISVVTTRRHPLHRGHRVKSARPASLCRRLALRIDAVKTRQEHARPSTKTLKRKNHRSHDHHSAFDASSDEEDFPSALPPPTPLEDLDEDRRQRATIATQLGLTLEEYEALDSAFGDKHSPNDDDEDGGMTARYHTVFSQYDLDGSGAISPDELRRLLKSAGEEMDEDETSKVIAQADTDGDGEINFEEFIALMRARKRLLLVAKTMGSTGTGPTSSSKGQSPISLVHPSPAHSTGSLPPLKLAIVQSKKHKHMNQPQSAFNSSFTRDTPTCLRPGVQVDMTHLRRELAIAEFGIQALNSKVLEGMQWVQQHVPVTSLKAQLYCQRWGMEKVHQLFVRLQSQATSRAFQKWRDFLVFERNKVKANIFLKCKGSQKITEIMNQWKRKTMRRRFGKWKLECQLNGRNERLSAALEIQRIIRGKLARMWRWRHSREGAAVIIQALIRGGLARHCVRRIRQVQREHAAACVLQRCYRGYSGKRVAKALYHAQRETLAARKIQRTFRQHAKRRLLRAIQRTKLEHDCAVQVQCCMRSHLARKERMKRADVKRRQQSSILIQRHVRGHLARKVVKDKKRRIQASITIQTRYRAYRSRCKVYRLKMEKQDRHQRMKEQRASIHIQTTWRSQHARKQYQRKRTQIKDAQTLLTFRRITAAVRIQSLFRMYRARRMAQRLRYEKIKWMNFALMNRNALRIQAFWRGYHGRLASQLRSAARLEVEREEDEAAKRIQTIARGKLAQKELGRRVAKRDIEIALQNKRVRSALKIQKVFRGKQARKLALKLKEEHQQRAKSALDRLVRQAKFKAAIKIQCCVRRFLARMRYWNKKKIAEKKRIESAVRLQQEHAAITIQCAMRRARARRYLLARRREFEKRISLMASEKAHDEIERLREAQEAELAQLRVQLMMQQNHADTEATKLRKQLELQRETEAERREQEAQELAKLRLETLIQQHAQQSDRQLIIKIRQQEEAERLYDALSREKQEKHQMEEQMRTEENEELARLKMTALLQTHTTISVGSKAKEEHAQYDEETKRLENDAKQLQEAAQKMKIEQAKLKIQSICLKYMTKRRLSKLHEEQAAALAKLHTEEEKIRLRAMQEKEMALAKLKAMMDDEAQAREQEIRALEAEMLERARVEKEKIAKRNAAARKIQARVRGFLGRHRVLAIQRKIDRERDERAKVLAAEIAAAEAKMKEALRETATTVAAEEKGANGSASAEASHPEDWVEYWDENAQASYFYNIRTQEASWTRPVTAPSSRAMEIVKAATGSKPPTPTVDYDADAYAGYGRYNATRGPLDTSGYAAGSEGYADQYGYYDQYGQYHYYEERNTQQTMASTPFPSLYSMNAYQQQMQMQSYAANAYLAQLAFNSASMPMMYGGGTGVNVMGVPMGMGMGMNMGFASQMMNPMMMPTDGSGGNVGAVPAMADPTAAAASPPDVWEKFIDQYTGSAYYYNSITGEKYWEQ